MTRSYYIRDEANGSPILRRILIILLILALLSGIAVGYYIYQSDRQSNLILEQFQQALLDKRYGDSITLYRQAQEKALASGNLARNQEKYKTALAEMENLTGQRLNEIETKLTRQTKLSDDDLQFAESMAEVSAVQLISYLRGLCQNFMIGEIKRPIMENAFNQLADLENLRDSIGNLPAEFDKMEAAQSKMIAAVKYLNNKSYWSAYHGFETLIKDQAFVGFVQDQASLRLDECKKQMYQPLLDAARSQIEGGRYLSAQTALKSLDAVFPDDADIQKELSVCKPHVPEKLVNYTGSIEVLSIKPLIVNAAEAFDGDAYAAAAADSMLTVREFSKMLEQLYANNYILIDSSRIYDNNRKLRKLQLPANKKPVVLVLEGLNYYASRRETGNSWDLVLDEGGEVSAEYPDASGKMIIDRKGEAIGILDEFVKKHPDFSLDGAKGTISLTGYECIFGAVTDPDQLEDRNKALQDNGMTPLNLTDDEIAENCKRVQEMIDRLKMTGWLFASSTYGFIDARNQTLAQIQSDTRKWLDQVGQLTGPVSFLNYPNGSFLTGSDPRAAWLKKQGFILFGGLGTTAYLYAGNDYIYIDKTPINGFTLRNSATYQLNRFFDVSKVYSTTERP